ncbi:MAG: hypothetical protein ACI88G_000915, partial [Woeseiaceae bacterium]
GSGCAHSLRATGDDDGFVLEIFVHRLSLVDGR